MSKIFMSYRRADSEDAAGRIYDALEAQFGGGNIFKDVYSLPLGADFRRELRKAVATCHLMLVIIGRHWLTVTDEQGRRRLDNPGDFVRIEVEAALERDIPVIPVLIQNTGMPRESDLPVPLADLAYRNNFTLRADPYFRNDVKMLITGMTDLLNSAVEAPAKRPAKRTTQAPPPSRRADESRAEETEPLHHSEPQRGTPPVIGSSITDVPLLVRKTQERWDLVKQVCKQKNRALAALLHAVRPVGLENQADGQPVLVLQTEYRFHHDKLREPESMAVIRWALAQVLEQSVDVKVEMIPG